MTQIPPESNQEAEQDMEQAAETEANLHNEPQETEVTSTEEMLLIPIAQSAPPDAAAKDGLDTDDTAPALSIVEVEVQFSGKEADDAHIEGAGIPIGDFGATRPLISAPLTAPLNSLMNNATRPLHADSPLLQPKTDHAIFAQATNVGLVRGNNEDSAFSFYSTGRSSEQIPDFGLFIVADGMGGHNDGEKASAISTRVLVTQMMRSLYMPLLLNNPNEDPIVEVLADAVQNANHEIINRVPDGGTTMTAIVVMHDRAYIAHVGDSRAYLIQRNSIEQMTRDHSVVQRLIELDHITVEEAKYYPNPNVLYRALGQGEMLDVDTLTRRLPANSRLLLCSDGLWGQVEEAEILSIVMQAEQPAEACRLLVEAANANGGVDNVTAIILHMPQ